MARQRSAIERGLWLLWVVAALWTGACARAKLEPAPELSPPPASVSQAPDATRAAEAPVEPQAQPSASLERRVIHKAALTTTSDDVRGAADRAVQAVTAAAGYVAGRQEQHAENHVVHSRLELRVPAPQFEHVLGQLKAHGVVVEERITGQDVTEEFSDVSAKLRTLATLEGRLLALAGSRNAVKDLLEVERELQRVRSESERLAGRKQWLENQTAFASIELDVFSPDQPLVSGTESVWSHFGNALSDGRDAAVEVTAGLIRITLALAPLVPLAVCLVLVYRGIRRRRSPRAAASTPA